MCCPHIDCSAVQLLIRNIASILAAPSSSKARGCESLVWRVRQALSPHKPVNTSSNLCQSGFSRVTMTSWHPAPSGGVAAAARSMAGKGTDEADRLSPHMLLHIFFNRLKPVQELRREFVEEELESGNCSTHLGEWRAPTALRNCATSHSADVHSFETRNLRATNAVQITAVSSVL